MNHLLNSAVQALNLIDADRLPLTAAGLQEEVDFYIVSDLAAKKRRQLGRTATGYRLDEPDITRHFADLRDARLFLEKLAALTTEKVS